MKAKDLHHTEDEEESVKSEKTETNEEEESSSSVKNTIGRDETLKEDGRIPLKPETEEDYHQDSHTEETTDNDFDDQNLDQLSRRPSSGMNPTRPKSFSLSQESDDGPKFSSISSRLNQQQIPSTGLYSKNRPRRSSGLKFLLLLIVGVLVIGGSIYVLKGQAGLHRLLNKIVPSQTPVATPVEEQTPMPTPSPTPAFDRAIFSIRVLNGSGKTGLAASVSAKLKNLGYNIAQTGNATNSAFLQTVVLTKANDASLSAQLVQDLSPDFNATVSGTLKSSDTVDGEVIIGAK